MNNDNDLILGLQMSILKRLDSDDYVTSVTRQNNKLIINTRAGQRTEIEIDDLGTDGKDGRDGVDGKDGVDGRDGVDGKNGKDGKDGRNGIDGKDGEAGKDGRDGVDGKDGKDGVEGKRGPKGADGNGIVDIKIDQRGHLIIVTRDKTYDLGNIKRGRSGGGGGSTFVYTNSTPMPVRVGGFPAGTTFNKMSLYDLWTGLLYPTLNILNFTSFTIAIGQTIEIGSTITAGNYETTWAVDNPAALKDNSISIEYVNDNLTLASNLPNTVPINLSIPMIETNTTDDLTFRISGLNHEDVVSTRDYVVAVQYRIYVGENNLDTITESDVENLRINELRDDIDGEYNLLGGGYKWFCYPTAMGTRDNFYDVDTGFQIAMIPPETVTIINAYGVETQYYCYRTFNVLNGDITIGILQ